MDTGQSVTQPVFLRYCSCLPRQFQAVHDLENEGKKRGGRWTLVRWWNKGKVEEETGKMFRYEEARGGREEGEGRVGTSKDTSLSNISTATKAPYSRNPRPSRTTHRLFSIFRFCFEPRLYRVFPHFQRLYRTRRAGYFWWWWWGSILIITFRLKKRDDSLNLNDIFARATKFILSYGFFVLWISRTASNNFYVHSSIEFFRN